MYWDAVSNVWGISRYQDIVDIEKDPRRYTSSQGSRPRIPADVSMINQDDPLHQNRRRIVARRFTPRSVKQHEDHVRGVVTDLIDAVIDKGECEVVMDLAAPLPARVICEMLGFEPDLAEKCREWSETTMLEGGQYNTDGSHRMTGEATMNAVLEFAAATLEVIAARRADPRDDLISVWAHSDVESVDGTTQPLSDDEIVHEALLLLDGGAETTRTVIGTMCLELIRHPDQRAKLIADPSILGATGVEEFIRWVTPILNMRRTSTEDHELHDQAIRAGDELVLMYSSANRDERVFDDPDTLRRHPSAQPPRGVRVRNAFLLGCVARPPRDPRDVRGAASPDPGDAPRAGRGAHPGALGVRVRLRRDPRGVHAGVNDARIRLMPWMKFDRKYSGSPVISMSGSRRKSSPNIT